MINIVGLDRLRRQIDHRNWEQPKLIRIADAAVEYRHSRDVSNGGVRNSGGAESGSHCATRTEAAVG